MDAQESEMIVRQISWLRIYCSELDILEQPGMPMERHQGIMALREQAPHVFKLYSSLLKDALIVGIDNLLDAPKKDRQLTLEYCVNNLTDLDTKKNCTTMLKTIKKSDIYREVKIARNHLIAHPNRETLLRLDKMSPEADFPNLTIPRLKDLLRQATDVACLALGKLSSDFWFNDWLGVSQLFDRLKHNHPPE
jgi:hypothetical protein